MNDKRPRKQCKKCPWKKSTDPFDIPDGYCPEKHAALSNTIAMPGALSAGTLRMMACHETAPGAEKPCVGWLSHQLGPGNNLSLRIRAITTTGDERDALTNWELDGEQHETFEATLPRQHQARRRRRKK